MESLTKEKVKKALEATARFAGNILFTGVFASHGDHFLHRNIDTNEADVDVLTPSFHEVDTLQTQLPLIHHTLDGFVANRDEIDLGWDSDFLGDR